MTLTLEASRLLLLWWCALHALLAAAALLVGWPWLLKAAVLVTLVANAVIRRPRVGPRSILVDSDGSCSVPEWGMSRSALGPRTLVCGGWIRLDLRSGISPVRRDLVLFVDQLGPHQWAQLRALLERVRRDAPHVSRRPREPI